MTKSRIENFSDGVFSILITLMIFQFKVPKSGTFHGIFSNSFINMLIAYATSFLIIAGFWIRHHMVMNNLRKIDTLSLWVNIFALFPLTIIPFATLTYGSFESSRTASMLYTGIYILATLTIYLLNFYVIRRFPVSEELQSSKGKLEHIALTQMLRTFYSAIPILIIAYFFPRLSIFVILIETIFWMIRSIRIDHRVQNFRDKKVKK